MFEILDSMIATVVVVLVISLIVQSLQQVLKQLFGMKSKFMERELFGMFAHVVYKRSVMPVKMQYQRLAKQHPEASQLVTDISKRLSGVGYDDLSMVESLKKDEFLKLVGDLMDTGELETTDMSKLDPAEKSKLTEKMNFLQQARLDAERWYDVTMKSFQDHYERRMKMWAFVLGGLVVIWLNANLFEIYREFSTNKVLRDTAVKLGERFASTPRDSLIIVSSTSGADSAHLVSDSAAFVAIRNHLSRIDSLVHSQSFSMMRWNSPTGTPIHWSGLSKTLGLVWEAVARNLFGWLGMILLVGLGTPFWYDILKTLIGVKDRLRGRVGGGESREAGQAASVPVARSAEGPVRTEPPAVG